MIERHETWLDTLEYLRVSVFAVDFGKPDQADAVTEHFGLRDIGSQQFANAACLHSAKIDLRTKAQRCQNRQFMRRVDAVDVEARVGLGKALGLCIGKHICKVETFFFHRRQDEIAGAVENTVNAVDAIGRSTIAQSLNNRDPAGNGCLEF